MKPIIHKSNSLRGLFFAMLFIGAFLERTLFDMGPNFELITTAMILSSFYFGKKVGFWLTFAIVASTDRFIGNSSIFLFTWSGFLIPVLFTRKTFTFLKNVVIHYRPQSTKNVADIFSITTLGLSANIFFYLWTNFGVWLLDSFNMYPNTLSGLTVSYINALPFLKYQMISTLIFLPLTTAVFFIAEYLLSRPIIKRVHPAFPSTQ